MAENDMPVFSPEQVRRRYQSGFTIIDKFIRPHNGDSVSEMKENPIKILIIGGSPDDHSTYRRMLENDADHTFTFLVAGENTDGETLLNDAPVDCVLLDYDLPDSSGLALLENLVHCTHERCTPVILLTAVGNESMAVQAMKIGAADYLNKKTLTQELLVRAIRHALERRDDRQALLEKNAKLQDANDRIVEQQKALIEEERLKVLLQMAGATAHELTQPLGTLMGYIDLLDMDKDDPATTAVYVEKMKDAGHRIARIVQKIQNIRPEQADPVPDTSHAIAFDRDIQLLVIEDGDDDYKRIDRALAHKKQIHLSRAHDISDALDTLNKHSFDMIILDYLLPTGNGLDFLAHLEKQKIDVPVIFSTGHGDEMIAAKAIQGGAYDYLPKAKMDADSLLRMVAHTLEKHRLKNEVRQAMQTMADMSVRDDLTGLYNRRYMNELLDREFSRAQRYGNDLSCLLIDMDFFKQVNDSYGHIFGDHVLKCFAAHLRDNVRDSDFCFRYGGEEFMVLLPNTDIEGANQTAEKFRAFVEAYAFTDETTAIHITISVGSVSLQKHHPEDVRTMLAYADKALYQAKAEGRNRLIEYMGGSQRSPSEAPADVDLVYFRERLASILIKTRSAALNSLSLLMNQLGADYYKEQHQKALIQIELMCNHLRLPGAIAETIKRAAAIHDYLKALLPQSVLSKKEPLDEKDRECIQSHSAMLAELVQLFEVFRMEREILLYHQENYDGSGYPIGLKGEQIPFAARIFAIADAVAAMMFDRPHRKALDSGQIIKELIDHAGTQFDPSVVSIFLQTIEDNPTLTLSEKDQLLKDRWLDSKDDKGEGKSNADENSSTDQ